MSVCKIGMKETTTDISGSGRIRHYYAYGIGVFQPNFLPETCLVKIFYASDTLCL